MDGGNYSSLKEEVLLISEMEELLMLSRMMKDKKLQSPKETDRLNNSGRLSILIRRKPRSPRDFTQTSACTVTDHSTLSQDSQ